jgi:hypothetical protein
MTIRPAGPSVAIADVAELHFVRDDAFVDTEGMAAVNASCDGRAAIDWCRLLFALALGAVPLLEFFIGEWYLIAPPS